MSSGERRFGVAVLRRKDVQPHIFEERIGAARPNTLKNRYFTDSEIADMHASHSSVDESHATSHTFPVPSAPAGGPLPTETVDPWVQHLRRELSMYAFFPQRIDAQIPWLLPSDLYNPLEHALSGETYESPTVIVNGQSLVDDELSEHRVRNRDHPETRLWRSCKDALEAMSASRRSRFFRVFWNSVRRIVGPDNQLFSDSIHRFESSPTIRVFLECVNEFNLSVKSLRQLLRMIDRFSLPVTDLAVHTDPGIVRAFTQIAADISIAAATWDNDNHFFGL